jgi:hypothetical protein
MSHIIENFFSWLQLCFKLHPNRKSTQEVMGFQSRGSPNFKNFGSWESWDKVTFGCSPVANHREHFKKEGGGFPPSLGRDESCESAYARGSSVHQKCSNYTLTNLLFGLCTSMWIIDPPITHLSPHPKTLACLSTRKMLRGRERTLIPPSVVFTFGLLIESIKEFGGASLFMPTPWQWVVFSNLLTRLVGPTQGAQS